MRGHGKKSSGCLRVCGFSLLEILIALMILSVGLTGVLTFFGMSQARARQAEAMTTATMLARQKMADILLDLEKRSSEGRFPSDDEEKTEPCAEKFADYQCTVRIRKVEIPLPPAGGVGNEGEGGKAGAQMAGMMGTFQMFLQQLKLEESVREVKLTIKWSVRNRERSFSVTTHVVKL